MWDDLDVWLVFVEAFTIVILSAMTGALIHEYFYCKRDDDR
jgi:hypothetical protein